MIALRVWLRRAVVFLAILDQMGVCVGVVDTAAVEGVESVVEAVGHDAMGLGHGVQVRWR